MADMTRLADILRAAGLTVVEVPGWKTRGRPGSFAPTRVLCHHTAGRGNGLTDAKSMFTNGRPDLKAPLCQLALDRQGVWYVGAAGRANHAGRCKPIDGLRTYGNGRPYGDGNEQMVGVEAQNDGREPWPDAQYASYVRGVAAITKAYGWRAPLGHKETSLEGKPDPHFDMNQFRRDVAATNPNTAPAEEDGMPYSKQELQDIAAAGARQAFGWGMESWRSPRDKVGRSMYGLLLQAATGTADVEVDYDKVAEAVVARMPEGADRATMKGAFVDALKELAAQEQAEAGQ